MNTLEVTRNVILDLLPLYLAGEASADTMALVRNYLKSDPDLAKMAERMSNTILSDIPAPVSKEDALQAYIKANQRLLYRTLLLGAVIVFVVVGFIAAVMAVIYGGFR